MKRTVMTAAAVAVLASSPSRLDAGGNANFMLGARALDREPWVEERAQGASGVMVDFGKEAWPIRFEAAALGSGSDGRRTIGPVRPG